MTDEPAHVRRDGRIPDTLWACIQPWLPPRKPHPLGCHRPRVDDRRAMEAICFVLRTGCPWNARQDTGLCASRAAHRRVQEWAAASVFLAWWGQGLAADDALQGIDWEWLAMDGAMTNAPLGGDKGGKHPTDRGTIGTKRSVRTDGGGVPVGLAVAGANRHDCTMGEETLTRIPVERPRSTLEQPPGMCLDNGSDDDEVREWLAKFGCTAHIRARGEDAQAITRAAESKARRWVVERTHRWMTRCRRVLVRWDKTVCHDLACLHLACASITYRRSGLLG